MSVRAGSAEDVPACIAMLEAMRLRYQTYAPQFWKKAENSAAMTKMFFAHLLGEETTLFLVAEEDGTAKGFLMARPQPVPPVFEPGRTAFIDDFCVADDSDWAGIGGALLDEARAQLKARGFEQIVVVSAQRDAAKMAMLDAATLTATSSWFAAKL